MLQMELHVLARFYIGTFKIALPQRLKMLLGLVQGNCRIATHKTILLNCGKLNFLQRNAIVEYPVFPFHIVNQPILIGITVFEK